MNRLKVPLCLKLLQFSKGNGEFRGDIRDGEFSGGGNQFGFNQLTLFLTAQWRNHNEQKSSDIL